LLRHGDVESRVADLVLVVHVAAVVVAIEIIDEPGAYGVAAVSGYATPLVVGDAAVAAKQQTSQANPDQRILCGDAAMVGLARGGAGHGRARGV
jgi:hypothetical protein